MRILPPLNHVYYRDTVLNVIFISDLTDAYNLAMDKYGKESPQAGSDIDCADLRVSSSSFGQLIGWDTHPSQEYGPSLRGPDFAIPSTSNRHVAPGVDVLPFNLPSVDMSSHYVDSSLQGDVLI